MPKPKHQYPNALRDVMAAREDNLSRGLAFAFGVEGKYLSPEQAKKLKDPGGETKWGISKRSYPRLDIKNLTKEDAELIYRRDFWRQVGGDELGPGASIAAFDFGINSGPGRVVKAYRSIVGLPEEGPFDDNVKKKLRDIPDAELTRQLLRYRGMFLQSIGHRYSPEVRHAWKHRMLALSEVTATLASDAAPSGKTIMEAKSDGVPALLRRPDEQET